MKQINFENSNYSHKEELKTFLSSFNDLMDKFSKSLTSIGSPLNKINAEINRKKVMIEKLDEQNNELAKREEELKSLKTYTSSDIKTLEARKKMIDYTDSEVQKMEKEDIDTLINSKKNKISKIEDKLSATREKIAQNKENKKTCSSELKDLENQKRYEEENIFRTENIIKLLSEEKERLNDEACDALTKAFVANEEVKEIKEQPQVVNIEPIKKADEVKVDDKEDSNDVIIDTKDDYSLDFETDDIGDNIDIDEPTLDIEPIVKEVSAQETEGKEEVESTQVSDVTGELSLLDFDAIELPEEALPRSDTNKSDDINYRKMVEETFQKENIDYQAFDEATQISLVENADRVLKNLIVLKKHQIPLELTIKQPKIYYNISPQDLDDLLNIITVDEDGNGMGFTIDFVFYTLDELSQINVDKLIEVYNNEFMNVNSKTGLIKLLKMANNSLGDFEANRRMNMDTLKSLGVENVDVIEKQYKDFINLDNPLFLNALNLFDKNDLVTKINNDVKIIPKIMEYWLNN